MNDIELDDDQGDALLDRLARVLDAVEPRDPIAAERARAGLDRVRVEAELADLLYDSVVDEPEVAVRSDTDDLRSLRFGNGTVTIHVEVDASGHLMGQLVPPSTALIELHRATSADPIRVTSDELGVFGFERVEGPFSLHVSTPDTDVQTSWVSL